jgi:hypothetical protein
VVSTEESSKTMIKGYREREEKSLVGWFIVMGICDPDGCFGEVEVVHHESHRKCSEKKQEKTEKNLNGVDRRVGGCVYNVELWWLQCGI